MGNFDYKHFIAVVVGIALGLLGTQFGIDFTKSCPTTAPASSAVAPVVPTK